MSLGKRIKDQLGERPHKFLTDQIPGLTQQNLSTLIGRRSQTSIFAIRIADRLGVSVRWLLDGVGAPGDVEWPFPGIDRARFDSLGPDQKTEIQGVVRARIEAFEADAKQRAPHLRIAASNPPEPLEETAPAINAAVRRSRKAKKNDQRDKNR